MPEIRLHVHEANGELPAVCMYCGEPATTTAFKRMHWCPPWVGVLIFVGLLPYAIVASILTRRATVQGPFCDNHKKHWFNRSLLMWGSLFLFGVIGLGGLVIGINLPRQQADSVGPVLCVGGVVLFVAWLAIVIWAQNTGIRPKEITDQEILLTGVAEEFVDAVAEVDRERKARRSARQRCAMRPTMIAEMTMCRGAGGHHRTITSRSSFPSPNPVRWRAKCRDGTPGWRQKG